MTENAPDDPREAQSARKALRFFDRFLILRGAMRELWIELVRRHGCALSDAEIDQVLEGDLALNTQGLMVWLERLGRH